ncbi:fimbrial protein [Scandinavium goeteborgense]|uniref:fimbrial protein n=1 Tax=Scandinavium goeteborgense TaxID=1851514 RepID=UPI0038278DEC
MRALINRTRFYKRVSCFGLLCFFGLLPYQNANALSCTDSSCKIEVLFEGVYQEETCEISINGKSATETVLLPTLSTASLQNDGEEAGQQSFNVSLKGCPINRTISLYFVSGGTPADEATGNLVNTAGADYSQNVQIRLRNAAGNQMVIDDAQSVQDYEINARGDDITHDFSAQYYANGASAVSAGLVSGAASIDLIYK